MKIGPGPLKFPATWVVAWDIAASAYSPTVCDKDLPQAHFPEHFHNCFHWGLVCDLEWRLQQNYHDYTSIHYIITSLHNLTAGPIIIIIVLADFLGQVPTTGPDIPSKYTDLPVFLLKN